MTPYLQSKTLYAPLITSKPSLVLNMVIVIPCYKETNLLFTLMSLAKCHQAQKDVEIIVLINDSEADTAAVKAQNRATYEQALTWVAQQRLQKLRFHILYESNLPKKHAGVGLARKIGMDEAVWRFEKVRNKKGIIVCFDADSRCQANYLQAIEAHFEAHPKTKACNIHYEHPLTGFDYEDSVYDAIELYELHLRYYVHAQAWTAFPFAYQTIGSSMAVRADAYQAQGGMNRRKAGEDFYFLHKFIPLGDFTEITNTTVIPSPRTSDRVPFGTGKAVQEILKDTNAYDTYAPETFIALKSFFEKVVDLYSLNTRDLVDFVTELPPVVRDFLATLDFYKKIEELQGNTASLDQFEIRFYKWFNAFMMMKYVHYARDHYYENVSLPLAAKWLLTNYEQDYTTTKAALIYLRKLDKKD